jgi:hypothetical protein
MMAIISSPKGAGFDFLSPPNGERIEVRGLNFKSRLLALPV